MPLNCKFMASKLCYYLFLLRIGRRAKKCAWRCNQISNHCLYQFCQMMFMEMFLNISFQNNKTMTFRTNVICALLLTSPLHVLHTIKLTNIEERSHLWCISSMLCFDYLYSVVFLPLHVRL